MSVNLRYPNITAAQEREQLAQIKSYLYQLVDQLNYALPTLGTDQSSGAYEVQGGELSYYELRSLIISTTSELHDQYEKLYKRLETDYAGKAEFNALSNELKSLTSTVNTLWTAATNLEATDKAIRASIDSMNTTIKNLQTSVRGMEVTVATIESMRDFVEETGNADGWTYKKWYNGDYDMVGTFTMATTSDSIAEGSMFRSEVLSIQAPFAIDSAVVSGSADDLFLIANGGVTSTEDGNSISFVLLRSSAFNAGTEITVRIRVTGTYNPGGIE